MSAKPSDYERRAREQIHDWKNPEQGWFGQTMRQIGWPVDRLGSLLQNAADAAGLSDVISKALAGLVRVLTDAAAWAVRRDAVYAEFRTAGHDVRQPADLTALDLEQVDKAVGWLDAKYTGMAFMEGAAVGAAGAPGVIADIPALVALNLRAIAEYATYSVRAAGGGEPVSHVAQPSLGSNRSRNVSPPQPATGPTRVCAWAAA